MRNVVNAVQERPGIKNGDNAIAAIGAAGLFGRGGAGGDPALPRHADFNPYKGAWPAAMGEEGLLAAEFQAHLAAGGAGQQAGDDLEIERFGAGAKAAADKGLDHPDA